MPVVHPEAYWEKTAWIAMYSPTVNEYSRSARIFNRCSGSCHSRHSGNSSSTPNFDPHHPIRTPARVSRRSPHHLRASWLVNECWQPHMMLNMELIMQPCTLREGKGTSRFQDADGSYPTMKKRAPQPRRAAHDRSALHLLHVLHHDGVGVAS